MERPREGWPPDAELDRADWTGIDAPFGWPEAMVEAVHAHARGERWPKVERHRLRFRETDRFVHDRILAERGTSVWPLSVAADRIAACAWRCAELLSERGVDRTGAGGVVEVYPAGALGMWGLPHRGYKRNSRTAAAVALAEREAILARIRSEAGPRLEVPDAVVADDDGFDAFVSALVARAAAIERTIPPPPDKLDTAAREGWIHLPLRDSLATVLKSPKPAGP